MRPSALFLGVSSAPVLVSDEVRTISKTGFDGLKARYLFDVSGDLDAALESNFADGQVHPIYPQMFVYRTDPRDQGGGVYEVEVEYKGLLKSKGYRTSAKVTGETSTGENIEIALDDYPAFAKRIKIEQPVINFEVDYYVNGFPSLEKSKQKLDILFDLPADFPALPTPPAQVWTSITDPTYVYPSGWILDDRSPKQLEGTPLYQVKDRLVFRYPTEM